MFASYPTEWLTPTTMVSLMPGMTWEEAKLRLTRKLANYTSVMLPSIAEAEARVATAVTEAAARARS